MPHLEQSALHLNQLPMRLRHELMDAIEIGGRELLADGVALANATCAKATVVAYRRRLQTRLILLPTQRFQDSPWLLRQRKRALGLLHRALVICYLASFTPRYPA